MDTELVILMATIAGGVIPWAFSIHGKVAAIANSVESLPLVIEEVRETLLEHGDRLDRHDGEIAAIRDSTRPSC